MDPFELMIASDGKNVSPESVEFAPTYKRHILSKSINLSTAVRFRSGISPYDICGLKHLALIKARVGGVETSFTAVSLAAKIDFDRSCTEK